MAVIPVILIETWLLPKIEPIDVAVAKIKRPLMRLEGSPLRLTGYVVPNRKSPSNDVDLILSALQFHRRAGQSARKNPADGAQPQHSHHVPLENRLIHATAHIM